MTLTDYLKNEAEQMPEWLANYVPGSKVNVKNALQQSRIVYYPGSEFDGDCVKEFNKAHAAHMYIYVDYSYPVEEVWSQIDHNGFAGYRTICKQNLTADDLITHSIRWHLSSEELAQVAQVSQRFNSVGSGFGLLAIFERADTLDDTYGAKRFALIFLGADGIATYDALFGSRIYTPYAALISDHGWGWQYASFGRGGLLEKIAKNAVVYPKYLLHARVEESWEGYTLIPNVDPVYGGMGHAIRRLFKKD